MLTIQTPVADRGQTIDPLTAAYTDRMAFPADGRLTGTLEHPDAMTVATRLGTIETGEAAAC